MTSARITKMLLLFSLICPLLFSVAPHARAQSLIQFTIHSTSTTVLQGKLHNAGSHSVLINLGLVSSCQISGDCGLLAPFAIRLALTNAKEKLSLQFHPPGSTAGTEGIMDWMGDEWTVYLPPHSTYLFPLNITDYFYRNTIPHGRYTLRVFVRDGYRACDAQDRDGTIHGPRRALGPDGKFVSLDRSLHCWPHPLTSNPISFVFPTNSTN